MDKASKKERLNRQYIRARKWRSRRGQGIGDLLHSVYDLNSIVYDEQDEMMQVRNKLRKFQMKLKEAQENVEKYTVELRSKTKRLHKAATELHEAVNDLQLPSNPYDLNEEENAKLKVDLLMAEEDVVEALKQIHDAEADINFEEKKVLKSIMLPNFKSKGVVPLNGIVKINRHKCCICLDAKIDCVLYKCGHICTCYSCTQLIMANPQNRKCPVCRNKIKDVIRTYIVSV